MGEHHRGQLDEIHRGRPFVRPHGVVHRAVARVAGIETGSSSAYRPNSVTQIGLASPRFCICSPAHLEGAFHRFGPLPAGIQVVVGHVAPAKAALLNELVFPFLARLASDAADHRAFRVGRLGRLVGRAQDVEIVGHLVPVAVRGAGQRVVGVERLVEDLVMGDPALVVLHGRPHVLGEILQPRRLAGDNGLPLRRLLTACPCRWRSLECFAHFRVGTRQPSPRWDKAAAPPFGPCGPARG